MKKYTKEHQWIELANDGTAKVGITKFAAEELGEVTFVELPSVNKTVHGGEQLCVVESVKAASDVFMPVTGNIAEVNSTLESDPTPVNEDPEGTGWICVVKDVNAGDLDSLMNADEYAAFCK